MEDKYQALDNFQQLLHHDSDALVTKQAADGLEVRRADEVSIGAVYVGVGDVQRLRRKRGSIGIIIGVSILIISVFLLLHSVKSNKK